MPITPPYNQSLHQFLINEGATLNCTEKDNLLSLVLLAAESDPRAAKTIKYILRKQSPQEKKSALNAPKDSSVTPLMLCARLDRTLPKEIAVYLLEEEEIDLWAMDILNQTALHYAAESGDLRLIQAILDKIPQASKKQYLNMLTTHEGLATALHYALRSKHLEAAHLLIEAGADYILSSADGEPALFGALNQTALHFAAESGDLRIIQAISIKSLKPQKNSISIY